METKQNEVPITLAAQQLGVSRERAMRRVLTGALKGVQRCGRWYVDASSLRQALRANA